MRGVIVQAIEKAYSSAEAKASAFLFQRRESVCEHKLALIHGCNEQSHRDRGHDPDSNGCQLLPIG
jgi:hypothetical protein